MDHTAKAAQSSLDTLHDPPTMKCKLSSNASDASGRLSSGIPDTVYLLTATTAFRKRPMLEDENGDELTDVDNQNAKTYKRQRVDCRLKWSRSSDLNDAKYADWKIHVRQYADRTTTTSQTTATKNDAVPPVSTVSIVSSTVTTYITHRSVLGVCSDYFDRIFLGGFVETSKRESSIELPSEILTLQHFEDVLEYCYSGEVKVLPKNLIPMLYFSDYLGIESLRESLEADFYEDTRVSCEDHKSRSFRIMIYYKQAKHLGMDDVLDAIIEACQEDPNLLKKDSPLAAMTDTDLWDRLWEERRNHETTTNEKIKQWSENLADFFQLHPNLVDRKRFRRWTHRDSLPIISPKAAVFLMQEEQRVCTNDSIESLTCLQKRCIDALYNTRNGGWQYYTDPNELKGLLRKLPPIVMESILLKTITFERKGQNFPSPIVSFGGETSANGEYTMSGWFRNALKFTRKGIYEGKPREFSLYRYEGEWWISVIGEGNDEPGGKGDKDLYRVLSNEWDEESPLPPQTGWTVGLGLYPAPMIRFETNTKHLSEEEKQQEEDKIIREITNADVSDLENN